MFRMLWNTRKDGLCIHESFPSEHAQSTDFIRSGKAYTSFNLLRMPIFFSTKTTGLA